MNDEERLQHELMNGRNTNDDSPDVAAYRNVFRALEKDPGYRLPDNFNARVMARVIGKQSRSEMRDYLWFAAGVLFLAAASLGTIVYTDAYFNIGIRFDLEFLKAMAGYKGLIVFAVMFIVLLNWLDRRLVKGRTGAS